MSFELIILEGPQAGRRLPVGDTAVTFGRSPAAAFSFPEDNFMSGTHLSAQSSAEGLLLSDPRSTNGTFLNGQRVVNAIARVGDVIKIGSFTMQVMPGGASPSPTVVLSSRMIAPRERGSSGSTPPASPGQTTLVAIPQKHRGVLELLRQTTDPLYCLLDAAADEMIPSLLALAGEQMQIRCLYDGDSAVTLARWAPYLVELPVGSALLGVLVDKGWGKGWASYFSAATPFEELRKHFRKFLMVQIENGKEVYFRFYDPRVLRDFLPLAAPNEITAFCEPLHTWMVEAEDPGAMIVLRYSNGGLVSETRPVPAEAK